MVDFNEKIKGLIKKNAKSRLCESWRGKEKECSAWRSNGTGATRVADGRKTNLKINLNATERERQTVARR